jgi:RNA polymerase sigma factor (sigma-70 family)
MDPDFEQLPHRMASRDSDAYREFAAFFGPRLRGFFRSRGLGIVDAEDLAVSCVTDIALKVERYDPDRGGRFVAWVYTLASRSLIDWWRRKPPTEPLPAQLPLLEVLNQNSSRLDEVVAAVREAMAKLSERDQDLLRLRELGGMGSYKEIAEQLRIRPSAARVRHHRALRRLRVLLEDDGRIKRILQKKGSEA